MANSDAPTGLQAVRHAMGGVVRLAERTIADAYDTNIFTGDLVASTGTGRNVAVTAAGANRSLGVFGGCEFIMPDGEVRFQRYWPASQAVQAGTTPKAFIYDDPSILFEIQADEDVEAGDIGNTADYIGTHAGSTLTGQSGMELDSSDLGANADGQLKVIELVDRPGNAYGTHAKVNVLINLHENRGALTGL